MVEQKESIKKLPDGRFQLVVSNYGGRKDQVLTQVFTKEELIKEHEELVKLRSSNIEVINLNKKKIGKFDEKLSKELDSLQEKINMLKEYNESKSSMTIIENKSKEQDAVIRGLKQIESMIPELKRK